MRRCELDARHDSSDKVLDALARDLGFPQGWGRNLDALWDVLRTDIAGPVEIIWNDAAAARRALGPDFDPIAQVLRDVAAAREDVSVLIAD